MKGLNQITKKEFEQDSTRILRWLQDLADASHGEFDVSQLMKVITGGTHLMFYHMSEGNPTGMFIVTPVQYVSGLTMVVIGAAGHIGDGLHESVEAMEKVAKGLNCTSIDILGRKGWSKLYAKYGWKDKYLTVTRKL